MGRNDSHGYAAGLDVKLFGELVPGVDSWLGFSLMSTMESVIGEDNKYVPRPTDQLYNISLFFQDYVPGLPQYRVHVLFNWAQGLPVRAPGAMQSSNTLRAPDYRRVDLGVSRVFEKGKDPWMGRGFFKPFRQILVAFEVLNLFGFNNVNSYYWVSTIASNVQYAVPNYLTGRQFNLKLQFKF
jgi:hypothetical protein